MPTLSLNASKKTKHTPAGEIPVDWGWARTQEICSRISVGIVIAPSQYYTDAEDGTLAFRSANVREGKINDSNWVRLNQEGHRKNQKSELKEGDVLIVRTGAPGVACVVSKEYEGSNCIDLVIARPDRNQVASDYLCLFFNSDCGRRQAFSKQGGLAQKHLNVGAVAKLTIPLPPLPEQHRIAAILSTWDRAIETLESLIAAKERRNKALMQQLLTGRKRLPGFDQSSGLTKRDRFERYPADWEALRLGQITTETGKRNSRGGDHPVLSCTKHHGLVLSEEYFGRRVHAEDTSNYRLVHRGEFAYATNHIEEGSIGYQDLCETGLVSPIYTAFKSNGRVSPNYLFRVLKSTLFLHLYQVNTSASVDRRGSLRYKEFSQLPIWLPSRSEQDAITSVFDTIDRELTLHRQHLATLRTQKRGLMQKLLTGEIRTLAS